MDTIQKIAQLFEKSGKSANSILKELNFSPTALSEWKRGKAKPTLEAVSKLADYFDVSVDYLLGRTENPQGTFHPSNEVPFGRLIPMTVIGSISDGYDGSVIEDILDEYPVMERAFRGYSPEECFVLRVKGSSMYPDFHEGDYVLIHKQESVDSGDIAIILYNGDEATIKRVEYKCGEDWMELIPRNPEYKAKRIEGSDLQKCRILGKVISLVNREIN